MTPEGLAQLKLDEGCRLHAYPDPLTGGEPWTVGFGATGAGIGPHTIWTQQQADVDIIARIGRLENAFDLDIPWWRTLLLVRQDVLSNMGYNLGLAGLLAFHHALAAMKVHDWNSAADNMLSSAWHKQLPHRSQRLADEMRTGVR